ncbi:MAG: hypothetical protein LBJ62_08875 [Bifidobacteriaceae bacterium]|nr:hypothetical protein [Bifidobacteriaceae bacterium]
MNRAAAGLAGGAAVFGGITILSRLAGFGRWGVFSAAIGSNATGSAYTAANSLPNILFEVVAGGALAAIAVPLLAAPLGAGRLAAASRTASALMTWALTVLIPLGAVLALAAEPLARALLDGAVEQARPGSTDLAAQLIRLFALQVPLYGVGLVASGVLQAAKRLFWPAFAPLLSSLTVIGVYLAFWLVADGRQDYPAELSHSAIQLLGWGTTAGVAALTLPLLIPVRRLGIRWHWTYRFEPDQRRRAASLAGSGVGALLAQQAAVLTAVTLAGLVGGPGALPTFNYAQAVYLLPYAVLAVPLAVSAFPNIAQWAASGKPSELEAGVAGTTRLVLAVSAIGAALLIAAAPAIQVLFNLIDHSGDVSGLDGAVVAFAPGLVGFGLMAHLQRVLFAVDRSRPAAAVIAAGWLIAAGCGAGLALAWRGGAASTVLALAAGTAVGMTVAGLGLLWQVNRALGGAALSGLGRTAAVCLTIAAAGAALGRVSGDAVLAASGDSLTGASLSGLTAFGVVAGLAAVGLIAGDRGIFRALPREPATPAPN